MKPLDKFSIKIHIFVPMNKTLKNIEQLLDIMDRLRVECPWDREQTMLSLRNNTIEECFELTDAIMDGDMQEIKKELGDVLLHVVFYSKIASETGDFDLGDVAKAISEKLIYRHPHVFGDEVTRTEIDNADKVSQNWERLKLKQGNASVLSGVAKGMPALPKAYRIGQKAANIGFDWESRTDVWDKVREEIKEVQTEIDAGDHDKLEAEFGDLFFALTNAARLYGINPDTALERTNRKFIKRFSYLESQTIAKGQDLRQMTLQEMDVHWEAAKKLE